MKRISVLPLCNLVLVVLLCLSGKGFSQSVQRKAVHFMMKSKTFEEAAANFKLQEYTKGNFNQTIADESIRWLNLISN